MRYYELGLRFVAECANRAHGACVLTRHGTLRSSMQGRCVPFLVTWLSYSNILSTKEEHRMVIDMVAADFIGRANTQRSLEEGPEVARMLVRERPLSLGESAEPL